MQHNTALHALPLLPPDCQAYMLVGLWSPAAYCSWAASWSHKGTLRVACPQQQVGCT